MRVTLDWVYAFFRKLGCSFCQYPVYRRCVFCGGWMCWHCTAEYDNEICMLCDDYLMGLEEGMWW